jgi:hypothetical protein
MLEPIDGHVSSSRYVGVYRWTGAGSVDTQQSLDVTKSVQYSTVSMQESTYGPYSRYA